MLRNVIKSGSRSDGLLIKGKYSLVKIFVTNSHFVISACLNRDDCFSFFFGGGGGEGSTLLLIVHCLFWESVSDFTFPLVLLYVSID